MTLVPDRYKRAAVLGATAALPRPLRVAARARLLAGLLRAQARRADVVIIGHPKSGGTWLRVMLDRLYRERYGLASRRIVKSDELARRNPALPRLLVTSGHYAYESAVRALFEQAPPEPGLAEKKVVLLSRHPCDVAVSWHLQFTKRISAHKKEAINAGLERPVVGAIGLDDFVMHDELGLPALIDYLNRWRRIVERLEHGLVVRYEDLRAEPAATLAALTAFIGADFTDAEIADAVAFASFDNLKALERSRHFRGTALAPADADDPDTYKVRRGKIGGFRDDFAPDRAAQLEAMVAARLDPAFGYAGEATPARAAR